MKKILIFSIVVCFVQITYAQQGVQFFEGSWKELLKKSQTENKAICIDVYTEWCKPCKLMEKEAFPTEKIANVLNTHFINYRIDAEKGEGRKITKEYEAEGYPTLLFLRPNGELFYKILGYSGINPLLFDLEKALSFLNASKTLASLTEEYEKGNRERNFLNASKTLEPLTEEYEKGNRERNFLWNYLEKRKAVGLEYAEVYNEYLKTLPDSVQDSKAILEQICRNISSLEGLAMEIAIRKYPFYYDSLQANDITYMEINLTKASKKARKKAIEKNDKELIGRVAKAVELIQASPKPQEIEAVYLDFYHQTKNKTEFEPQVEIFIEKYLKVENIDEILKKDSATYERAKRKKENMPFIITAEVERALMKKMKTLNGRPIAEQLNSWAWASYEVSENQELLEKALKWSEKAIRLCEDHDFLHTQAHLLWKLGRKKEAIQTQTEAVRLFEKMVIEGFYKEEEAEEIRQKLHNAWNEMNK